MATINGKHEEMEKMTIEEYLYSQTDKIDNFIIEYNYSLLKKEHWSNTEIRAEDNIEILNIVGGG